MDKDNDRDAAALIAMLETVVRTACNQHGLRVDGEVEVSLERRWDRHYGQLTVTARVQP